jgi:peroxin-5
VGPHTLIQRYPEAAERFFDALVMQESDATVSRTPPIGAADGLGPVLGPQLDVAEEAQGLTSGALWDSLRSASQRMGRADLATLCEKRDLEGQSTRLH